MNDTQAGVTVYEVASKRGNQRFRVECFNGADIADLVPEQHEWNITKQNAQGQTQREGARAATQSD